MRIAIDARLATNPPTGIGRVAINLIKHISQLQSGHEIFAITRNGDIPELASLPDLRQLTVPVSHLSPMMHRILPKAIRKCEADLVHYLYFAVPWFTPVPSVVTLHDAIYSLFPELMPPHHRIIYRLYMSRCVRTARRIICPSESAMNDILRFFPQLSPDKVDVVYNAADERFKPLDIADTDRARKDLGLPEHYVLYVGNHRGHKNIRRMIAGFMQACPEFPHRLVLPPARGRGAEITHQAIEEFGAGDRVVFHPLPDKHLPVLYQLADAFLFPSLCEGFGLPPLEAMSCGTPVITSNISSLPEVVGEAGIKVDPYDTQQIADAIHTVLSSSNLREELRTKGLRQATRFSWNDAAIQTLKVYEKALF